MLSPLIVTHLTEDISSVTLRQDMTVPGFDLRFCDFEEEALIRKLPNRSVRDLRTGPNVPVIRKLGDVVL